MRAGGRKGPRKKDEERGGGKKTYRKTMEGAKNSNFVEIRPSGLPKVKGKKKN